MKGKKSIIISLMAILLGVLLVTIGISLGGSTEYSVTNKGEFLFENTDTTNIVIEPISSNIKNITIDLDYISYCRITTGDNFSVSYDNASTGLDVTDDTLKLIKPSKDSIDNQEFTFISFDLNWLFNNKYSESTSPYIEITIPDDMSLENIYFFCNSGEVYIENVKSDNINMVTEYGNLSVDNTNSLNLTIQSESSDILINNVESTNLDIITEYGDINAETIAAKQITVEKESGDINLENIDITEELNINSIYGDIFLLMKNPESDHTMNINSLYNDFYVNGQQLPLPTVLGNGDREINITTESGDIEIEFDNN